MLKQNKLLPLKFPAVVVLWGFSFIKQSYSNHNSSSFWLVLWWTPLLPQEQSIRLISSAFKNFHCSSPLHKHISSWASCTRPFAFSLECLWHIGTKGDFKYRLKKQHNYILVMHLHGSTLQLTSTNTSWSRLGNY